MKINSINPFAFKKRLVARAVIGDKTNPQSVKIFHMNERKDYSELKRKFNSPNWKDSYYRDSFLSFFKDDYIPSKYLVMETKNGDMVCCANINDRKCSPGDKKSHTSIFLLETAPELSSERDKNRKYKYAGETMMACIVSLAKKVKNSYIELTCPDSTKAEQFYSKHCKFEQKPKYRMILRSSIYDDMLESNAQHINNSLDMAV